MIASLKAGPYTVRGVSLGGVYTSLHVPELDVLFDCGVALRTAAGVGTMCLSHAHADHIGALNAFLGIRGLQQSKRPLRVLMPSEIVSTVQVALHAMSELQRWPLDIQAVGMIPGDVVPLRGDLWVRAIKTFHPVPSLAYQIVRRTHKLRPEYAGLPGADIGARRKAGEELFDLVGPPGLAYATDTLINAVDHGPELLATRVLILEATFLDERKSRDTARLGCHVHLDEIIERADRFTMPHLVLMHLSQLYQPDEVAGILDARLPPDLRARTQAFVPDGHHWWP
jgi:ribonuclease Z